MLHDIHIYYFNKIFYIKFTSIAKDNILLFLYYLKNILRLRFFILRGKDFD